MNTLDSILSGGGNAPAPEQETTTQAAVEQTEATEQTTEQTAESEGGEPSKDGKQPPIGAIRQAEREKADKRYTAVLDGLRQEIVARDTAWEARIAKVLETVQPKAEPQPAPNIFDDAPEAIRHVLRPDMERMEQERRADAIALSKLAALHEYGAELVKEADQSITDAVRRGELTVADVQSIPPRELYQRAIKWHQQQQRNAPDFEEKLRAKILAELQQQQGAQTEQPGAQQRPAAVMPSNLVAARNVGARSGPAWAGPKPIEDIFKR